MQLLLLSRGFVHPILKSCLNKRAVSNFCFTFENLWLSPISVTLLVTFTWPTFLIIVTLLFTVEKHVLYHRKSMKISFQPNTTHFSTTNNHVIMIRNVWWEKVTTWVTNRVFFPPKLYTFFPPYMFFHNPGCSSNSVMKVRPELESDLYLLFFYNPCSLN